MFIAQSLAKHIRIIYVILHAVRSLLSAGTVDLAVESFLNRGDLMSLVHPRPIFNVDDHLRPLTDFASEICLRKLCLGTLGGYRLATGL